MKKVIITIAIVGCTLACKKHTEPKTEAPVKYYFKIEAVDNDGKTTITPYKQITVN